MVNDAGLLLDLYHFVWKIVVTGFQWVLVEWKRYSEFGEFLLMKNQKTANNETNRKRENENTASSDDIQPAEVWKQIIYIQLDVRTWKLTRRWLKRFGHAHFIDFIAVQWGVHHITVTALFRRSTTTSWAQLLNELSKFCDQFLIDWLIAGSADLRYFEVPTSSRSFHSSNHLPQNNDYVCCSINRCSGSIIDRVFWKCLSLLRRNHEIRLFHFSGDGR